MASRWADSPAPRRVVALKRGDGEPLTRVDIQYDVLNTIFSDAHAVFSDPYAAEEGSKLTFRELYTKAILHSPKATKALKDKMLETPAFAEDFAMLALLVNVGRVNTTMSFFPEMKTAIRTYHPVPALQRTSGNMQDAPRIKHILKTSLLEDEAKSPPSTPADILAQCKTGQPPSTSVTNLVFVLAHHTGPIGQTHFQGRLDFLDLFLRTEISSASRAQAFLWLCYNYLEAPSSEDDYDEAPPSNPFADPAKPTTPPSFTLLTADEILLENQDSPEDTAMAEKLVGQRNRIMQTQGVKDKAASSMASVNGSVVGEDEELPVLSAAAAAAAAVEEPKAKGKRSGASIVLPAASSSSVKMKGKRSAAAAKEKKPAAAAAAPKEKHRDREPVPSVPDLDDDDDMLDAFIKQRAVPRQKRVREQYEHSLSLFSSLGAQQPPLKNDALGQAQNGHGAGTAAAAHRAPRYSPYPQPPGAASAKDSGHNRPQHRTHAQFLAQPRTMLQQAWQVISTSDPLADSDDEVGGDEYAREDYVQRLSVINRLSQRHWPPYSPEMNIDAV